MRSINNRYLIEKEAGNEENFSKYIVRECETNQKYIFSVLKNDFTYEKTREYLLDKFKTIKNLNSENIVNLLELQIIYNMNGIKLDKQRYGYLMEYVDTDINTKSYINSCDSKEKLDIFMELCSIVNTLNIKGYIFKTIDWKDILLFRNKDNKIQVKIDNILQNELGKVSIINVSQKELPYPYNIEKADESTLWKDNISEIIQFFEEIFTDKELEENLKELMDVKKRFNQVRTIKKSYNLNYFIKYINYKLKENYPFFLSYSLNTIEDDIDTIGRREEIKIVEKNYQKIRRNEIKYKIISFNGDSGSGKTRLLDQIKYIIENKYFTKAIYLTNSIEDTEKCLLKNIRQLCDKQIYDKYNIYIRKFMSICMDEYKGIKLESNQQFQLINRVGKFMRECTSSHTLILLIDDLDKKCEVLKEFVRYISLLGNSLEHIIIVFSFNENSCDNNFLEYIKGLQNIDQYEEYKIRLFNQYETTNMIKSILNTNKSIDKLSSKIYSETLGNPQYIKAVINELYSNNILYFDEAASEWRTSVEVKDILIPKTLEKKLKTSISELNQEEIEVLRVLSIYETPLSEKIILSQIITDSRAIWVYKELKFKGYLIDKISDQGMLTGFSNDLLRNILYLKLDNERKKEMHKKASKILIQTLSLTDYYLEELIFHLEESEDIEKLCHYALMYAKKLELNEDYDNAVVYYKKVSKFSRVNRIDALISIAKIEEKHSEHNKSFENFQKALEFAVEEKNLYLESYILLEMVIIQINFSVDISMEIEGKLEYIRKVLDSICYPKGEAYYNYAMALKYRAQFNHSKSIFYAKNAIKICKNNNIQEDVYAWDMTTLVTVYMKNSKFEEAKALCLDAIEVFSKNKNKNGIIISRCMIAKINKEQGYPAKEVLKEYYEIERLSTKLKLYKRIIFILMNVAEIYIDESQYEEAEKSLLKALEIEKDEGIDFYAMNICTNLCIVYLQLGKYRLAVKYYSLINQMKKVIFLIEDDIFGIMKVDLLYKTFICNKLDAYNYLHKSYKINNESDAYYSRFIMCMYYELKLNTCSNIEEIEIVYRLLLIKLKKLKNEKISSYIKFYAIKTILDLGYYESARKFFDEIGERPKGSIIEAIYTYIKFQFIDKELYRLWIKKALKLCEIINDKKICAELYGSVAEKYEELGSFVYAVNSFYESISLHIGIINYLPDKDKLIYANNSGFFKVRKQLISCLKDKLGSKLEYSDIEKVENIKDLNSIIEEINIKNILNDRNVYKLIQETYEKDYDNDFSDIYRVFDTFSSDIIKNLENIVKYMARLTLSDKAILVIEDSDGENKVLCTYRLNDKEEINKYVSLKLNSDEDVTIVENNDNKFEQAQNEILKKGIRACVYMRLKNKERRINNEMNINGQLILISTKSVNYINSESKKVIEKFRSFLVFLLEKYKLTISSTLDKLTSTYNRKYLEESLLFLMDSTRAEHSRFALIMFDIDDFKGVNDKYGHQVGDEVLIKLTKEVKKSIGKNDIIGRYGGEEFIVLLPNSDKIKAINMADKIRRNVEEAKILGEKRKVTISLGIAMSSSNSRISSEEIVSRADQALYRAKHEGKNRYVLWNEDYLDTNNNFNSLNELSGVITGNATKDYNFISTIKDITSIIKTKDNKETKMYNFILKLMQIVECDNVTLFIMRNGKVVNILSKCRFTDGWSENEKFNVRLVNKTIINKKGCYKIDWNNIYKQEDYGIPDWKSICTTPIICDGQILAVIYISVSINKKEFTAVDLNKLNFLGEIGIPIFE